MTELIITEKPMAALKIATALGDSKPIKKTKGKSVYYEITRNKKEILVGCAVGHLFGLAEKIKSKWGTYPIFDIEWKPKADIDKNAKYTKSYVTLLKQLGKKADEFTVATDYDLEGAVIGANIIREALKLKDAKRMKFSTLTKDELNDSYTNASKHLDFNMIDAGETRHYLDWFYGINITSALSTSVKTATGRFKILSSGRVQSPTLKIIVDKEKEIKKFKPETYWEVYLDGLHKKEIILAKHKDDKIFDKKRKNEILKNTKNKPAKVSKLNEIKKNQNPPTPFDLTSLQIEAFRHLRISPKESSQVAQELYISGLISYPRTSSQKLPKSINYKKILKGLSKSYKKETAELLKKKTLKPNEGKKSDPAHPAIYPTGEKGSLSGKNARLYDLIVHRFLAVFGEPAIRLTVSAQINVNKEIFTLAGTTTIKPGWHTLYGKYAKFKEEEIPKMKEGDEIKVKKIQDEEKETQPPARYSQASIIKQMDKLNLGTKSTRAMIIDTLYNRGYIEGDQLEATELGMNIVEVLEKYSPKMLDEELTKHFEEEMGQIREGKVKKEKVISEAKKVLIEILNKFKKNEKVLGEDLSKATIETENKMRELGVCQKCGKGKLIIIHSKKTRKRFVACNAYPNCKTTYGLPQQGLLKKEKNPCKHDGFPQIKVITRGKRPWILCLNPKCPGKEEWKSSKPAYKFPSTEQAEKKKVSKK
ncbi:DNA topoisomerase I [Candidatus Woesearchaeota archaeon]|jgi:DNA topoisomerase I|nr:DNA topoisomerase I [Candidatus Woesearchaeota archaeon]MBT7238223.1 DNA topoisomerase I [Candidatus Woesearchaeota archaeon]